MKRGYRWTPTDDAELRRLNKAGLFAREIAERMGVGRQAIANRARRINLSLRTPEKLRRHAVERVVDPAVRDAVTAKMHAAAFASRAKPETVERWREKVRARWDAKIVAEGVPPHRVDECRYLRRTKGLHLRDAIALILDDERQIARRARAAAERAKPAPRRAMTLDEQLDRARRVGIVERPVLRSPDYAFSLTGSALA